VRQAGGLHVNSARTPLNSRRVENQLRGPQPGRQGDRGSNPASSLAGRQPPAASSGGNRVAGLDECRSGWERTCDRISGMLTRSLDGSTEKGSKPYLPTTSQEGVRVRQVDETTRRRAVYAGTGRRVLWRAGR